MEKGRIIKLVGGVYTVLDSKGDRLTMKARGKFRHQSISPKVGDLIAFDASHILKVYPRENNLLRPPVSNVDQAILIHSALEPDFSFYLLDRFLVLSEAQNITPVIVVTKTDLMTAKALSALKKALAYYQTYYAVYYTSIYEHESLTQMKALIADKISVFAGQTGAGKSSLLNALDIKLNLDTGPISKALGRGKHTTRHSELIAIYDGLVADTPGFSKLDFTDLEADDIKIGYPDFLEKSNACKFRACNHVNEPGCAVKKALEEGQILQSRYDNYLLIYEEIKQQKRRYKRK